MSVVRNGQISPVGQVLAKIESRLTEIETIVPSQWHTVVSDLIEIRDGLNSCLQKCSLPEARRLEQVEGRYGHLAQATVERLLSVCDRRLRAYEEGQGSLAADDLDHGVQQAGQDLENALRLLPARRNSEKAKALQRRLAVLEERMLRTQRLQKVQDAVQGLWSQADDVESAAPSLAVDYGKQAVDKADAALQAGGWEPNEIHVLQKLSAQARARYDDLRRRHEIPTTKQRGEELVPLIIAFAERAKADPKQLVSYFESDEPTADVRPMEVAQAVDIARQRLIRSIWMDKIEEYIRIAEARLREHKPDEAMAALRAWQSLPGLYDERVGVDFPRNLTNRIEEVQKRIAPELAALQQAQKALDLGRLERDALEAYGHWQSARNLYPYLPELETRRDDIVSRARDEIGRLIEESDKCLKAEQWNLSASRLQRVNDLLAIDPGLRSEFQDRYNQLQHIYERIYPLMPGSKELLKLSEQIIRLQEMAQEFAEDYWPGWGRLQKRLQELQARGQIQTFQAEMITLCRPDTSLEKLETLYRHYLETRDDPPEGLSAQDQLQLAQIIVKVGAWKGYAQARDELDKAKPADEGNSRVELVDVPDLKAAQEGLQAARADLAADQAVREAKLRERLAQLLVNDQRIPAILDKARGSLADPSLESLRSALRQTRYWLRQASSYGAELVQTRCEIQAALWLKIEEEIGQIISQARENWFVSLASEKVEGLLREGALLVPQAGMGESMAELAQGPLAMARAQKIEQAALLDVSSWEAVQSAWEEAAKRVAADGPLCAYCTQHNAQAHKRSEFLRAQQAANSEAAEMILRNLCEDAVLCSDWQVWFQHGRQSLLLAQEMMSPTQADSPAADPASYLARARKSLGWANKLATDSRGPDQPVGAIQQALRELSLWEDLVAAQRSIQTELPPGDAPLTAAQCGEARTRFETATQKLGGSTAGQVLAGFWNTQRERVRAALESQIKRAADTLERVDSCLSLIVLFPENKAIRARLAGLIISALGELQREVSEVQFDYTARSFLARFARRNPGVSPQDQDIAALQLEETRQTLGKVRILKAVLQIMPDELEALKLSPTLLEDEERALQDWQGQLEDLQRSIEQALQLAEDGLQVPEQFEVARYILKIGGVNSPAYLQIRDGFKDRAHPSYRAGVTQVEGWMARRQAQQKLRWRIERCLAYERAQKPEDLPGDSREMREQALVEELRQGLTNAADRHYPLIIALAAIRDMQHQEPDDVCLLQTKMVYTDPDNNRRYESLANIAEVIQGKVEQIHTLRRWLSQFTAPTQVGHLECPGIVKWMEVRPRIEAWRDSGPQGLPNALQECLRVRLGVEGYYGDLWPLTRGYEALSPEAMLRQLRPAGPQIEEETGQLAVSLCAVAQDLDREREELRRSLGRQIAECQDLETDIQGRIARYKQTWDTFIGTYNVLMAAKKDWLKGGQWARFQQAAKDFGTVCPNYGPFQEALRKAHERTNLEPPCLKRDAAP